MLGVVWTRVNRIKYYIRNLPTKIIIRYRFLYKVLQYGPYYERVLEIN